MEYPELIIKAFDTIIRDLPRVTEISVKKATGKMLDANEKQLDQGILNTGQPIVPEYSPGYRRRKNKPNVNPNLKDTGAFRRSFFVDVRPTELFFNATDSKTGKLKDKYSNDILGLTEKSAEDVFQAYVYPPIFDFINKTITKYV
jgi:hypothetical protein